MFKKTLILSLLLPAFYFCFSQKVEFEHLSDKDGLVNSNVNAIYRDVYGYMWIGTFNGLSRYDGYKFTNYINDPNNPNSINDNYISCIFESRDSTLFIGFQYGGFCIYSRKTDSFTQFRHQPGNSNSLTNDNVFTIYQDRNNNIWIGSRGGLDKFDPKTNKFVHIPVKGNDNFFVSSITEDHEGFLWLFGRGNFVCRFHPVKNTSELIPYGNTNTTNPSFNRGGSLQLDNYKNLWVASPGHGLFRYNLETGEKEIFSVENKRLRTNIVFTIILDSEGKIWFGTDGEGVYRYDSRTRQLENFRNGDISSLSSNAIYYIYESRPGEIWIGAYASGLNIYKKDKRKFLKYTNTGNRGFCLNNKSVLSIEEAGDGKIWLGTDRGGLNLFDPKNHSFKYYTKENSIINSNIVKSMYRDKNDNLWMGSYGEGLSYTNFKTGKTKVFRGNIKARGETILNDHVWAIKESYDHKIWLGLLDYGINIYDRDTERFTYFSFDSMAFGKAISNIFYLFEDSKKRMWVGTETIGLGYYDPGKKRFLRFKHEQGVPGSISSNNIHGIFEDSRGNLWIATVKGGLNRVVDAEKGIFESLTTKDGLPTDNIQSILEDDHGNLWLSTDKGISSYNIGEKKFTNFDIEDGVQGNEFNFNSALKTKQGYMYFGGIHGFNVFHPDSIHFNSYTPKVVLTDFKLFNNSICPGKNYNGRVFLNEMIGITREITLTHHDYIFSIEFSALDYTAPQKNRYAYRLLGFNNQWSYVNADQRIATYTNLDPGEYTFQVIASNNDGVWNARGASLKIIVLPPWWHTWWFRTLLLLLGLCSIAGFYYIRVRAIRKKNKLLEQEVKKRTAEILKQQEEIIRQKDQLEIKKSELEYLNRTKDKFFSIIGHDLKGPVKALTSLTGLLKEESQTMANEKQKLLTAHIDSSAHKIQNLILNLLEWARAQSKQIKITPVNISIPKLFKENTELLSAQAAQKNIQLNIVTEEAHEAWGDYNMICTVVRNILSNSIKYTPRGGSITLSSSLNDQGQMHLSIADNGVGMSKEILSKLFLLEKNESVKGTDNETGTGLGMIIAKEFMELNKGKIDAESETGKGSTFHLLLPVPGGNSAS